MPDPHIIDPSLSIPDAEAKEFERLIASLTALREPVEQVEKLPKPMWKGAWDDQRKGKCDECGGYHCLVNTIHLDYMGHAEVTKRLLDIDLFWDWEPLAFDADGLPKFDRFGGLWINLTVLGVTRKGYGDAVGKQAGTTAVKEIIGDAIRNAAMRFGVALDLWSKLDRHEQKNPGATDPPATQQSQSGGGRGGSSRIGQGRRTDTDTQNPSPDNDEAIGELQSVCDEHGYDRRETAVRFATKYGHPVNEADPSLIREFAAALIEEATAEPGEDAVGDSGDSATPGTGAESGADEPDAAEPGTTAESDGGDGDDGADPGVDDSAGGDGDTGKPLF